MLESNVFQTYSSLAALGKFRQVRRIDRRSSPETPFSNRLTLSTSGYIAHRLQSNHRDLIPNSGRIVRFSTEVDVWSEQASRSRAFTGNLSYFLPWLKRYNQGLHVSGGILIQNHGAVFNTDRFLPRGREDMALGQGTYFRYGIEYLRPLCYIDNGLVLLPLYLKALYAYGFAETLHRAGEWHQASRLASAGAGVGIQLKLFLLLDAEIRIGAARQLHDNEWKFVFR